MDICINVPIRVYHIKRCGDVVCAFVCVCIWFFFSLARVRYILPSEWCCVDALILIILIMFIKRSMHCRPVACSDRGTRIAMCS